MIRETLNDTLTLFSLSGFRKAIARGSGGRAPAIARLEFLRSRVAELEQIVTDILRHPRRRLAPQEVDRPYHRASRATGPEIFRSLRSGRLLRETSISTRLPPALKGFLPERIRVGEMRSSMDIPEHWSYWTTHPTTSLSQRLRGRGAMW